MNSAIPTKTQRDNKYCYTLWNDWVLYHANSTGEVIPLLYNITVEELQHCLCAFVLEVRKKDGNVFVPNTRITKSNCHSEKTTGILNSPWDIAHWIPQCEQAGIPGYHNHSLRTTAATRLHQSGCVEEQEIMQRTGHRSIEAVRIYKWTSSYVTA